MRLWSKLRGAIRHAPIPEAAAAALGRAGIAVEPAAGGAVTLRGATFAVKDAIRQAGGQWDKGRQRWTLPAPDRLELIAAALPAAGGAGNGLAEARSAWDGHGTKPYHGHRERLRQRCLEAGPEALPDYELLELLLFFSVWRRDTKPLARALLAEAGSLAGVLALSREGLARVSLLDGGEVAGDDRTFTTVLLQVVRELLRRAQRAEIEVGRAIDSPDALATYLRVAIANEPVEHARVLYLDARNGLVRDELASRGSVDSVPFYPREIVKRAVVLGAVAVIVAHNHPSGDPEPSDADVALTRDLKTALEAVGIALHDHVVVGRSGTCSFRERGLI